MHIRAITVEICLIIERMYRAIERNTAWLARLKMLSCGLWVLCH